MPRADEQAGEIHIKIVYHGPTLSGRTTNLQYIYNKTRPQAKGRMVSIRTETVQELFFGLTPFSIQPIHGRRLRVHLYTSPGCRFIEGAKERVLQDVDGIVFVADSRESRIEADIEAMESLAAYIALQGRDLATVPLVLQYNKRDDNSWVHRDGALYPDSPLPVAELDALLNRDGRPTFEAVAPTGQGVLDTLRSIATQVIEGLRAVP